MEQEIFLREYQPEDVQALASIYYHTIHKINSEHYTQEQVNAWAPLKSLETTGWREKFLKTHPIIATTREKIVGFVEFEKSGHIDCFYCHHEWVKKGVGSLLMKEILKRAKANDIPIIFAEVSITARPFFIKWGFNTILEQKKVINGVQLTNFKMERLI